MIRTTLVSHACLLIQTARVTLLTDPVLFDPHWEGINVICPSREVDFTNFPPVDAVYLSHRHQDHFDVRSLAFLRRSKILRSDCVLIAPKDGILLDVLRALDYTNIKEAENFVPVRVKDVILTPTPSLTADSFPEHGLLVHDGESTVWNQVDTIVNPQIIQYIHHLHGRPDFAHMRFLPLLEGNFTFHQSLCLPFEEYGSFLKVVNALRPKFVAPGSAGFRYTNEFSFLNRYSFPTSQDQFVRDLRDFCPEVPCSVFLPGDVAEITPLGTVIKPQAGGFVRMIENDGHLAEFKPVMTVAPIKPRADNAEEDARQRREVAQFIDGQMADKLMQCQMAEVWRHWKVVYQIEVFHREGSDIWTLDFGSECRFVQGGTGKINLYEGIGVTEFYKLLRAEANWDFVGASAQFRTFHNIYRVDAGDFESYPQNKKFPQPLMEVFPEDDNMSREKFMKDVRLWKAR